MKINSRLSMNNILSLALVLIGVISFAQGSKQIDQRQKTTKKQNVLELYYFNTIFKIKDERGNVSAEKIYNDLTVAERKALPNIFLNGKNRILSKEEILEKLKKGGPEVIEINPVTTQKNLIPTVEIYNTTDLIKKPEYPGGMQDFYKFIGANYNIPKTPPDVFLKGRIYLTFIVEKDGSLTDFKIVSDIGYGTGEEAIRVLKLSKKWIPGKTSEGIVAVLYSLPITIQSAN